jgi:hypothetical protein
MKKIIYILMMFILCFSSVFAYNINNNYETDEITTKLDKNMPLSYYFGFLNPFAFTGVEYGNQCKLQKASEGLFYSLGGYSEAGNIVKSGAQCEVGQYIDFRWKRDNVDTYYNSIFEELWFRSDTSDLIYFKDFYTKDYDFIYYYYCFSCVDLPTNNDDFGSDDTSDYKGAVCLPADNIFSSPDKICLKPFYQNDEVYCDVDDIKPCTYGCDTTKNKCKNEPIQKVIQKECYDNTFKPQCKDDKTLMKCKDNKFVYETCSSVSSCTYNNAGIGFCDGAQDYYCIKESTDNGYSREICPKESRLFPPPDYCYETYDECYKMDKKIIGSDRKINKIKGLIYNNLTIIFAVTIILIFFFLRYIKKL